jgi:hypothetical protein
MMDVPEANGFGTLLAQKPCSIEALRRWAYRKCSKERHGSKPRKLAHLSPEVYTQRTLVM